MRYNLTKSLILTVSILIISQAGDVFARRDQKDDYVNIQTRKLNGPRIGMTYVCQSDLLDRNGQHVKMLKENGIGSLISLFGWHFEWMVTPEGGGPSFVTELIPFLGGVEYATVIPSVSLVMGIRLPNGFEFGLGPNVMFNLAKVLKDRGNPVNTSLIVAIGQSINYSGVSIPINLAVATNNDGTRFSLVFGYAMGRRNRKRH